MSGIAKKRVGKDTDAFLQVPVDSPFSPRYNNGNGGGNMNDKYVTHKEFNKAMGNIDKHFNNMNLQFEKITTKLEKQKNDIVFAILTITGAGVGFLSLLIAIIALLKPEMSI